MTGSWGDYKRFLELCSADESFIRRFREDEGREASRFGQGFDPSLATEAWEILTDPLKEADRGRNSLVRELDARVQSVHSAIDRRMALELIANPALREWTRRQRRRLTFTYRNYRLMPVSASIAFELSDGCSVQCPFCCFDAQKFNGYLLYSEENRRLWDDVLRESRRFLGEALSSAVCYMATEPLDNPDYELFIRDFNAVAGCWPQTTTALAQRDPERMRRLMRLYADEGLKLAGLRFSVVLKSQLDSLYAAYTPQELECVELLMNNRESRNSYSGSGRAARLGRTTREDKVAKETTSACVTGYIVNMVRRTVSLVTPEPACEAYPLGMDVYDTVHFADGVSFGKALEYLAAKWMGNSLRDDVVLKLNRRISCSFSDGYVKLVGEGKSRILSCSHDFQECMRLVCAGRYTFAEIKGKMGLAPDASAPLRDKLNVLFSFGYLQEHPGESEVHTCA